MFRRILFPTDFSEVSLYSLNNCIPGFFEKGAEELILLHVIDTLSRDILTGDSAKKSAMNRLGKIAGNLEEKGIKTRYTVVVGTPSKKIAEEANCPSFDIIEKADVEKVDLIIIPFKGRNVLREMFIGSTARNVIRQTRVPTLLLKYTFEKNEKKEEGKTRTDCSRIFEHPLIALDLSLCSDSVIETVKKFQEHIKEGIFYHTVDYGRAEEIDDNIAQAERQFDKLGKMVSFPVSKKVETGEASENIMAFASQSNATLIVTGKLGRGMLDEILVGSTTNSLMRKSKEPLLVVPC